MPRVFQVNANGPMKRRTQGIVCHRANSFSPNLTASKRCQECRREYVMTIKSIVVPLEIEYLQEAAKERGISRTKLVRIVMEKVVRDELVSKIITDDDLANVEPHTQRYRRFRNQY